EARVGFEAENPRHGPNFPDLATVCAALTSVVPVAAAVGRRRRPSKGKTHVSWQSPNSRGRKRTAQSPRGIQAGDRREIRPAILHHEFGRKGCTSLSLRGVGTDRAEAGLALHLQSYEEEVSGPGELLRTGSRDGRVGAPADSPDFARRGADPRRRRGAGEPDFSDRPELGDVP